MLAASNHSANRSSGLDKGFSDVTGFCMQLFAQSCRWYFPYPEYASSHRQLASVESVGLRHGTRLQKAERAPRAPAELGRLVVVQLAKSGIITIYLTLR
jgi:hypothetical protein